METELDIKFKLLMTGMGIRCQQARNWGMEVLKLKDIP